MSVGKQPLWWGRKVKVGSVGLAAWQTSADGLVIQFGTVVLNEPLFKLSAAGKRQWYLRNLRLITNWMNHLVFPFNATFYLIAAISKWLSVGLLLNASLKIRRGAGRKIHAGLQQEAGPWLVTWFS